MMIRRGTIIATALIVYSLWAYRESLLSQLSTILLHRDPSSSHYTTRRSQAFVIPNNRWVEFPLPPNTLSVRVVTNATLDEMPTITPAGSNQRDGWRYALDYQLQSNDDALLDEGTYHFRTDVTRYIAPESGKLVTDKFFVPNNSVPCDSQTFVYNLRQVTQPCRVVRLRARPSHDDVREIVVRVYYQQTRPNANTQFAWQRLSLETRESICRALVYPQEITTSYERQNLMRWQWNPSYPRGTEGIDYLHRLLYYADELPGDIVGEDEERPQNLLHPATQLGIPIPAQGGVVQLDFSQLHHRINDAKHMVTVTGQWTGGRNEQRDFTWTIAEPTELHQVTLSPGVLLLHTDQPISVRPIWIPPDGIAVDESLRELPTSRSITAYMIDEQLPLEFAISHIPDHATPFRLSLRHLYRPDDPELHTHTSAPVRLHWTTYNDHGTPLQDGELAFVPTLSTMDSVDGTNLTNQISEPEDFYFAFSQEVATLRLQSATGTPVVTAFTRPPHQPRITAVPEDYQFDPLRESQHRAWFIIQPKQYATRVQQGSLVRVLTGYRPQQQMDTVVDGEYTWESITPTHDWKGRELLIPRDNDLAVRDEALNNTYYPIPANLDIPVRIVTPSLAASPSPRLIFHRNSVDPVELTIHLDGKLVHHTTLHSQRGEILLPTIISQTSHIAVLRIESPQPVDLFMRHVQPDHQSAYLKLIAQRFNGQLSQFVFDKRTDEEEILRIQLFRHASEKRCELRVAINELMMRERDISHAVPRGDWTVAERLFDVAPSRSTDVLVLGTEDERVAAAQTCFVHFGSDLPKGPYTVSLSGNSDASGYLILYRLSPGRAPRHQISVEVPRVVLVNPTTESASATCLARREKN